MKLTAKQKERLKRPRPFLFLIVIAIFGLPWALLFATGVKARHQRAQMDEQAASFLGQLPTYPRNQSAAQFEVLTAALGFAPNDSTGLDLRFDGEAGQAYENIRTPLSTFLRMQAAKTAGPLDPIPPELTQYLETYGDRLQIIQTHLLTQPVPLWDMTYERMVNPHYPFPGFFNVRNVQELLLLSALEAHQKQQTDEMTAALEASWQLNQALLQRPDLTAQVSVSAVAEYQSGLLRHLNDVPTPWIARLNQQTEQQSVIKAHEFEAWLLYKIQQHSLRAAVYRAEPTAPIGDKLQSTMLYWFSPAYVMQLKAIDTAKSTHHALEQLTKLDVCTTPQQTAQQQLSQEDTADWNQTSTSAPEVFARRWKMTGDRALHLELTQKVLQAKQYRQEQGSWPTELPELASTTCTGANWTYSYHPDDDSISISLDKPPMPTIYSLGLDPGHPIPFEYASNQSAAR